MIPLSLTCLVQSVVDALTSLPYAHCSVKVLLSCCQAMPADIDWSTVDCLVACPVPSRRSYVSTDLYRSSPAALYSETRCCPLRAALMSKVRQSTPPHCTASACLPCPYCLPGSCYSEKASTLGQRYRQLRDSCCGQPLEFPVHRQSARFRRCSIQRPTTDCMTSV